MRRMLSLLLAAALTLCALTACGKKEPAVEKRTAVFYDVFDTVVSMISYQESAEDFDWMVEYAKQRYTQLDHYYDIYTSYEGLNNLRTVNENAGIAPVKVDREIIDLLEFALDFQENCNGRMNICMGSVLKLWHEAREAFDMDGEGWLPDPESLREAAEHTDPANLVIDRENMTVYISDPDMSIDVGAVAKGYATELVARELSEKYDNFAISAGGNVRCHGTPKDGRSRWQIGITNPMVDDDYRMIGGNIEVADFDRDMSLVCSGGYQRFMVVDGIRYHHIVSPDTLYPVEYYAGVAIMTPDSALADALSTAVFLMDPTEAIPFVDSLEDVECVLTLPDGTDLYSAGAERMLE